MNIRKMNIKETQTWKRYELASMLLAELLSVKM